MPAGIKSAEPPIDLGDLERLNFVYPHAVAAQEAAKTSVSRLRQRGADQDAEARPAIFRSEGKSDGRLRGIATHAFLEHLRLDGRLDAGRLAAQARKMNALSAEERAMIDFDSIAHFWSSAAGAEMLQWKSELRRELEFTCKITRESMRAAGFENLLPIPEGEFVILQGIVDVAALLPREIWLLDFKTDEVSGAALAGAIDSYRSQLALYSLALTAIYSRPVTRQGLYFVPARKLVWL